MQTMTSSALVLMSMSLISQSFTPKCQAVSYHICVCAGSTLSTTQHGGVQAEAENTKFALEQKVLELQSRSTLSSSSGSAVSTPASGQARQTAAQQQQQEAQRQQQAMDQQVAQQQQMADLLKQNEELLSSRCTTLQSCAHNIAGLQFSTQVCKVRPLKESCLKGLSSSQLV